MNLVYCYNTNSKVISIEAMLKAYQQDYEIYSWHPEICLIERRNSRWNVYYDNVSLQECQKKCREIFEDKDKIEEIFNLSFKVIDEMDNVVNSKYNMHIKLNDSLCKQYITLYSRFLNYYSFSNEFCFKENENRVIEELGQYLNDDEINLVLSANSLDNTYTAQAYIDLNKLKNEYQHTKSIDRRKLDRYISNYAFLYNQLQKFNLDEYISDVIRNSSTNMTNLFRGDKDKNIDIILRRCREELSHEVNIIIRMRNLRLKMRECMMKYNFYFSRLLYNFINERYSSFLTDTEQYKLVNTMSIEQLYSLENIDPFAGEFDINTIIYANNNILKANKLESFGKDFSKDIGKLHKNQVLKGKVVVGKGKITGIVNTKLYSVTLNSTLESYIYVTKSLHPKDLLLSQNIKAIVVDEGGILSHASIIAKEMNIPCIIDTRIASLLINDGDELTIDFGKAEISIIDSIKWKDNYSHEVVVELSNSLKDRSLYGNKCVNLCSYIKDFNVAKGYVIESEYISKMYNCYCKGEGISIPEKDKRIIEKMFPVILRSSSIYEDREKSTAAGLLESVPAIDNFDEFNNALICICESSKTKALNNYMKKVGHDTVLMPAILIQKYYDFDVLGVLMIGPEETVIEYRMGTSDEFEDYKIPRNMTDSIDFKDNDILGMIVREIKSLNIVSDTLVEFGIMLNKFYILQIRKFGGLIDV